MFHSFLAVFLQSKNLLESRILSGECVSLCSYELKFGFFEHTPTCFADHVCSEKEGLAT